AESPRDEVHLVLDDEIRWRCASRAIGVDTEQRPRLRLPGEHRELVDGADDKGRRIAVHVLVDDVDRETSRELAVRVGAAEDDRPVTLLVAGDFRGVALSAPGAFDLAHLRGAPRAPQDDELVLRVAVPAVELPEGRAGLRAVVGSDRSADPDADGERVV